MNTINKITLIQNGVSTTYDLVGNEEGLEARIIALEDTLDGVNEFLEDLLNTY